MKVKFPAINNRGKRLFDVSQSCLVSCLDCLWLHSFYPSHVGEGWNDWILDFTAPCQWVIINGGMFLYDKCTCFRVNLENQLFAENKITRTSNGEPKETEKEQSAE